MLRKLLTSICLVIFLLALLCFIVFCIILFSGKDLIRWTPEMVEHIMMPMLYTIGISFALLVINSFFERRNKIKSVLAEDFPENICPVCKINLASDCKKCPNCGTEI